MPARSRFAEVVREVVALHAEGSGWAAAHERMRERLDGYHWMHVIGNAVVVAAAARWWGRARARWTSWPSAPSSWPSESPDARADAPTRLRYDTRWP